MDLLQNESSISAVMGKGGVHDSQQDSYHDRLFRRNSLRLTSFRPRDWQGISAELNGLARLWAAIRGGRTDIFRPSSDLIGFDRINDTLLDCRQPTDPLCKIRVAATRSVGG